MAGLPMHCEEEDGPKELDAITQELQPGAQGLRSQRVKGSPDHCTNPLA